MSRGKSSHLAYAFIHLCILGKLLNFGGSKFQHAYISLFGCYSSFDHIDFPLRGDGLGFDLLNQLGSVSGAY